MTCILKTTLICSLLYLLICQPAASHPRRRPYRHARHQPKCLLEQVSVHVKEYCELCDEYPEANKILKGIAFKSLCQEDQNYLLQNASISTNKDLYDKCCLVSLYNCNSCSKEEWRKVLLVRFLDVLRLHMSG